ncbi:hypothetical protein like AT1G45207 [Hibiscus trionum]|uniref:Remorin C-terminal domain-containing protein n=1 Tax=Hibiscus trionum TaxID=183268 RepID=A0A9W7IWY4_HIBTR|nr:hypothetical protein like AT1G45207 [Hibiscus trionum]
MAELGFLEKTFWRSGYRARDASPDSVIFTPESNPSLFSSASASVDRCSSASDVHDHDSLASELSLHLAAHGGRDEIESSSGPDSDPDPNKAHTVHKHSCFSRKGEKVKDEENDAARIGDENQLIDSTRYSFSLAIKECQDRRIRSDSLLKNPDRRRASLDLNNVSASSPRLGTMKKSTVLTRKSGAFPISGAPNHHHQSSAGMQKGWSSERVALHNNGGRRQGNAAGVLPFNNGKTLPSKWEDAERWIFSPVSGDAGVRQLNLHPQRRPKSKSGPLGPPGIAYHSLYSPPTHMFDGGRSGNFMAVSPFSAGVIAANGLTIHSRSRAGEFSIQTEPCMARSVSVHGCSRVVNPPSLPSQDEYLDATRDAVLDISDTVSRRDAATQMSPQGSTHSSPIGRPFSPPTPTALRIMELQSIHCSKSEVRDVQVDERVTMTRWSKKHRARNTGKSTKIVDDRGKRAVDTPTSSWDVTETAKHISRVKREEAKITAWENLQKAKAEAAIRKLEMKLEKKRSSTMDKITNKLSSAQKRAQEMRSSMIANEVHQVTRSTRKAISFHRTRQMGSLSGCFTCHTF